MKVLFATDGSHHATDAVRFLNRLTPAEPIDVTVMTVTYRPENLDAGSVRTWFPEWHQSEQARIDAHYKELKELLVNSGGSVQMVRCEGSPVPTILDTAKRQAVDLIALGARGHTTLERMLLGSVSDAVATHANCSVIIVRPPATVRNESAKSEASSGLKITLAVDGSEGSQIAANDVLRFNWGPGDRVTVLSVASMPDYLGQGYALGPPTEYEKERLTIANNQVCNETLKSIEAKRQLVTEGLHVGETIVDFAKKDHEDLILLGESGHSRFAELMLGSTSKYVIRHAPCSVWVARRRAET